MRADLHHGWRQDAVTDLVDVCTPNVGDGCVAQTGHHMQAEHALDILPTRNYPGRILLDMALKDG
jgi:hypothetical protein